MKPTDDIRHAGAETPADAVEAGAWETRLLALNALVELARCHAVDDEAERDDSYRLERALAAVNRAVSPPSPADAGTVDAAVAAFGETLASLGAASEQRR